MRLPQGYQQHSLMYKCHKHVTHAKISYFYVEFNLVDVCLDLEGPFVSWCMVVVLLPSTQLSTRQLRTLIRLFVLEGPANRAAVGCQRQWPHGRAI